MQKVAARIRKEEHFSNVLCAYLEIASPSIQEAIQFCVEKKSKEIRILPYFVLTGRHVRSHIPEIANEARKKYGNSVKIVLCPYLGYDDNIVILAKKRILEGK